MSEQIRIYCAEPGAFHGGPTPRPHWIDTFLRTNGSWRIVPPSRARARPQSQGEILHRTSEVAVTAEGEALRYAFKYSPTIGKRWGGTSHEVVNDREVIKVAIDLRTGAEHEAQLEQDYQIDHVTYEMRCPCGKKVSVRRERLHPMLDKVAAADPGKGLSLSLLEQFMQMPS